MAALAACLNHLPLHQLLGIDACYLESCQGAHTEAKAIPSNTSRPHGLPIGTGLGRVDTTGNVDGADKQTVAISSTQQVSSVAQQHQGAVNPGIHTLPYAQTARAAVKAQDSEALRESQIAVGQSVAVSPLVSAVRPPTAVAVGKSSASTAQGTVPAPARVGAGLRTVEDEDDDLDELLNMTAAPQNSGFGAVKSRISPVVGGNKQELPSLEDWLNDL